MRSTFSFRHITLYILLATLWSCAKNDRLEPINPPSGTGNISFKLHIPGMMVPATYSLDASKEENIGEIEILLFHKESNGQYMYEKGAVSLLSSQIQVDHQTHDAVFSANIVPQHPNDEYVLGMIANPTTDVKQIISGLRPQSKASVMDALQVQQAKAWDTGTAYTPIPMYCETGARILTNGSTVSGLAFTRALAGIDLNVSAPDFKLLSASVYSYNIRGYVAPEWDPSSGLLKSNNGVHVPQRSNTLGPLTYNCQNGTDITGDIYAFESEKQKTYLVIYGEYKGKKGYYRIDFTEDKGSNTPAEYMPLLRNHKYTLQITAVNGDGKATAAEAQADMSMLSNINVKTLSYNLKDQLDRFVFNGQDFIATNRDTVYFSEQGGKDTIAVGSSMGAKWTYTIQYGTGSGSGWVKNTVSGSGNKIIVESPYNFTAGSSRDAILTLKCGNLSKDIHLSQDGYSAAMSVSNCYLLENGSGGIKIPVQRAVEGNALAGRTIHDTDPFTAELLWTDCPHGVGPNSVVRRIMPIKDPNNNNYYILVVPGSSVGNAVIAMRDQQKNIIWSWHIWVVNLQMMRNMYAGGANKVLKCNIGATSLSSNTPEAAGMFYQWGRKDPFPGANLSKQSQLTELYDENGHSIYTSGSHSAMPKQQNVSVANNLLNAIQHPDILYVGSSAPFDWLTNNSGQQRNDLWYDAGNNVQGKTIWDPCPDKYRVASEAELNAMGSTRVAGTNTALFGLQTQDGAFYQAGGYVSYGRLTRTDEGRYWVNSTSGSSAQALSFDNSGSLTVSTVNRENAASVRCVKKS